MHPTNPTSTTSIGRLHQLILKLSKGDRVRLLQFGEAMLNQKSGKRQQRAKRRERPVIEDWRIGG